jgi:hypothetical protein
MELESLQGESLMRTKGVFFDRKVFSLTERNALEDMCAA